MDMRVCVYVFLMHVSKLRCSLCGVMYAYVYVF